VTHANHSRTYRNLSARPTSVNTLKVNEDYLHIKQIRALANTYVEINLFVSGSELRRDLARVAGGQNVSAS